MLYLIITWVGLYGWCLAVGHTVFAAIRQTQTAQRNLESDWPELDRQISDLYAPWIGLVIFCISTLGVAVFTPLDSLTVGVMLGVWLAIAAAVRLWVLDLPLNGSLRPVKFSRIGIGKRAISLLAAAVLFTQPVIAIDAGRYHYSLIRWLSEYGVPPGLALLNPQFGFTSAWFAAAAALTPAALMQRASCVMSGFAFLLAVRQSSLLISNLLNRRSVNDKMRLGSWFLLLLTLSTLFFFLFTPLLNEFLFSPSPDFVVVLLSLLVGHAVWIERPVLAIFFAIAAVSCKLVALPLVLVAALYCLFKTRRSDRNIWPSRFRQLLVGVGISLLILPFLSAQTLASACPLYPSTMGCFPLSWQPPTTDILTIADQTHGWETWFGSPDAGVNRTLWLLLQWFNGNQSNKLITVLIVLSVVAGVALWRYLKPEHRSSFIWLVALSMVGTGFMMLKAPLFRFVMAYVLYLPMLAMALVAGRLQHVLWLLIGRSRRGFSLLQMLKRSALVSYALAACLIVVTARSTFAQTSSSLWLPQAIQPAPVAETPMDGVVFRIALNEKKQCWVSQLPCTGRPTLPFQLRQPLMGIDAGFERRE